MAPTLSIDMRKLPCELFTTSDLQRIFGVSRRTARRWMVEGLRPELLALARLVKLQDLGAIDPAWSGWIIRDGRLYDPQGSAYRGWKPEQVRALEYLHELRRALVDQVDQLKAKKGLASVGVPLFPGDRRRWDRRQVRGRRQELAGRPPLSATPET